MKKFVALFLCALLAGSVVIGCADKSSESSVTTDTQTQAAESSTESDTSVKDGIPEGLKFEGTSIVTTYREDRGEFFIGESGGNIISDALYKAMQPLTSVSVSKERSFPFWTRNLQIKL